jgi:hypothetical protein
MHEGFRRYLIELFDTREQDDPTCRDLLLERELLNVLRWRPDLRVLYQLMDDKGKEHPAIRTLHDLCQGVGVTRERMLVLLAYVIEAVAHYRNPDTVEPQPGRNAEAATDFRVLQGYLEDVLDVTV